LLGGRRRGKGEKCESWQQRNEKSNEKKKEGEGGKKRKERNFVEEGREGKGISTPIHSPRGEWTRRKGKGKEATSCYPWGEKRE